MKKVIGILAVVLFAGNIASAELLKNFKANGSVEVLGQQSTTDFDKDTNDTYGDVKNRVMVNASFDLNEDVSGNVSVNKCDRSYAQQAVAAQPAQNVTALENNLWVEQAYLNLKGVLGLDHKVGRQYYGNDGDIVIYFGPANWYTRGLNAAQVALDGWTANWNKNKLSVGAIVAKLTESNNAAAVGVTNDDINLNGATASYDYSEVIKPAAYIYEAKDMTGGALNNVGVVGLKATGMFKGFNYGVEYAMNKGANRTVASDADYKGSAMKFNVEYGLDFKGKLNLIGEYASGSGDKVTTDNPDKSFQDIQANYRPGLIAGGVGVAGFAPTSLNNLTTWNVGANWAPEKWNKLNLGVKYYSFAFTEATNADIGTEADLVATWNHSENVALKLGLAQFMPAQDLVGVGNKKDAISLTSLYMNVKF